MNNEYVICAIARTENLYIREWVDYHLSIGFSHIYIYDNNQEGEERVSDVIDVTGVYREKVTIIPLHHRRYIQMWAYTDFYANYNFDWVAFIDIDEFITPVAPYNTIGDFISSIPKEYDAVYLNWRCYGDNGRLDYTSGPIQERLSKPLPDVYSKDCIWGGDNAVNETVKTLVRKNCDFQIASPHNGAGTFMVCNAKFKAINKDSCFHPYTFENCYIRHYITKTLGEYIRQKSRRQSVNGPTSHYNTWAFFAFNAPTIGKLRLRRRLLKELGIKDAPIPNLKWWIKNFIRWAIVIPFKLGKYGES